MGHLDGTLVAIDEERKRGVRGERREKMSMLGITKDHKSRNNTKSVGGGRWLCLRTLPGYYHMCSVFTQSMFVGLFLR